MKGPIIFKAIAKRKGRSEWGWFFIGFIPLWGWLAGIWLASLPDKAILEEVGALVTELQKFDFLPKANEPSKQSYVPETWQCNCGKTNSMDEANCPDCGLKRDYALSKQTPA